MGQVMSLGYTLTTAVCLDVLTKTDSLQRVSALDHEPKRQVCKGGLLWGKVMLGRGIINTGVIRMTITTTTSFWCRKKMLF